jgi:hypothetical protein
MTYEEDKTRHPGKTAKDRATGAMDRNRNNKLERDEWAKDPKKKPFPLHTCNGKQSRSIRTFKKSPRGR